MKVKKVINNNLLCTIDEKGHELIVSGKGIGFKRKIGERVDPSTIEKTYRMEDKTAQRLLRELVEQTSTEYLDLPQELIDHIKTEITHPLNESLIITLADHISFAIQRKEGGSLLISFDMDGIKKAGYLCTTPMIVCNTDDYRSIKPLVTGEVKAGQDLLAVIG